MSCRLATKLVWKIDLRALPQNLVLYQYFVACSFKTGDKYPSDRSFLIPQVVMTTV